MCFFKVSAKNSPKASVLREMIANARDGAFCNLDPLDGEEHSYLQVGGWIGDQGMALMFMGLGEILGLWKVVQPKLLGLPDDLAMQLAGAGMVCIKSTS
jgi:hypothetical protein